MAMKFAAAIALLGAGLIAPATLAQTFPSRPINVIVGTAPGDPGDIVARLVQNRLAERLGQPWVVETRAGASAKIASHAVARAAPDGHTLLVTLSAHVINPASASVLPYDTIHDFAGVSLLARQPLIVAVHPSVKGANLAEFLAAAKANPGAKLAYSSPGAGSLSFLVGEQIARRGGIEMAHATFRGGSPAVQALLTNEVQLSALIGAILLPHIRVGTLRAIAVTSATRIAELPDVPTLAELGFESAAIYNWIGVFAPAATPAAVVNRLNAELNAALREPAIAARLGEASLEIVASTPAELDAFVAAEIARWRKFTRDYNIRFE